MKLLPEIAINNVPPDSLVYTTYIDGFCSTGSARMDLFWRQWKYLVPSEITSVYLLLKPATASLMDYLKLADSKLLGIFFIC